jgi:hypothetical protein
MGLKQIRATSRHSVKGPLIARSWKEIRLLFAAQVAVIIDDFTLAFLEIIQFGLM